MNQLNPRNRNKDLHNAESISIDDDYCFDRIVDILNECLGKNYKGYQRGTYSLDDDSVLWFPKMAIIENGIEKSQSRTKEWINTISEDGKTIRMYSHTEALHRTKGDSRDLKHITFAKFQGEPYRYIGTFVRDYDLSQPSDHIFRRIETEFDLTPWRRK
ncbi:MAG: hypothetical protein Q4C20_11630 [Erysipelotrichaceae bacterium]|nr:hypothetical protein [Erysipelotrichaceae bacterium]